MKNKIYGHIALKHIEFRHTIWNKRVHICWHGRRSINCPIVKFLTFETRLMKPSLFCFCLICIHLFKCGDALLCFLLIKVNRSSKARQWIMMQPQNIRFFNTLINFKGRNVFERKRPCKRFEITRLATQWLYYQLKI